MITLTPAVVAVKFDSAAITPAGRPFGFGVFRRPFCPSPTDLAFESGRTIGLEAEHDVDAPAHYSAAERAAFLDGLAEASAIIEARYDTMAEDIAGRLMIESGIPCW